MAAYLTCEFCQNKEKDGMSNGTPACSHYKPVKDAPPGKADLPEIAEPEILEPKEEKGPVRFVKAPVKRTPPKPEPVKEEPSPSPEILTDDEEFFQ